jgi:NADPH:quinone reductase-like Zn-dependent oxidoreductase
MTYPATARAVLITTAGGPEVLQLSDVPVADPGPNEIVVRIRAVGVNPVEAKIRRGTRGAITEPTRIGSDAAGEVVGVGEGAPFAVGDPVIGWGLAGAYAEYVTASAGRFVAKPDGVSFEQGAAIGIPVATAYQCVKATGLQPGETLLVHAAAGDVGQAAVQFARRWGAEVVGTASERNHDRLRELGAVPVSYGDGLLERVRAAAPRGVHRVLESAGTQEAIDASLALVDDPRRIVEIVVPGWRDQYGVQVFSGGLPGSMTPEAVALRNESVPLTADLVAAGEFQLELGPSFPLSHAADAHRQLETGHTRGKIVLLP